MTNEGIIREYWAYRFVAEFEKGREPTADYFDTDFVDDAIDQWANEDDEELEVLKLKANPDEWDEVSIND